MLDIKLNAAHGMLLGLFLGLTFWAAIFYLVFDLIGVS